MLSKKILILSMVVSLTSHVFIISMAGLVEMKSKQKVQEILTIDLKESVASLPEKPQEKVEKKDTPSPPKVPERIAAAGATREETVNLGSSDEKYVPYLKRIKRKIEGIWTYPKKASELKEEGTTVVKFTIERNGMLKDTGIVTTSGSDLLDQGTLSVIKSASPFDPLPQNLNLAKLHIVATFNYKID
jgi:periplasmic protein TonB